MEFFLWGLAVLGGVVIAVVLLYVIALVIFIKENPWL